MKKTILAMMMAAAFALALVGCTSAANSVFGVDVIEETGALKVTADNAEKDATLTMSLSVEEGSLALLSPDLQSGAIEVIFSDDSGSNVALDQTIDGRILSTYPIDPGDYKVTIICAKDGTTGTAVIATPNAEEVAQQDAALQEVLDKNNIKLESTSSAK